MSDRATRIGDNRKIASRVIGPTRAANDNGVT
jgi:hypothetical protein